MPSLVRTTDATSEPVTTAEQKAHMRVDISDDDSLIAALVKAARMTIEELTGRGLIEQTWEWRLDRYPAADRLRIPVAPLLSVTSIATIDEDAVSTIMSASDYVVDTKSEPGQVVLKESSQWPDVDGSLQVVNAVVVTFKAGYGTTASAVPEQLKLAIKMLAAHFYENREAVMPQDMKELPMAVALLIDSYRSWNYWHSTPVHLGEGK